MTMTGLAFIFLPDFWVSGFIGKEKSPEAYAFAIQLIFLAGIYQLADGVQCVGLGILRGIEDTKIPTVVTFFAYWVIGLPLSYTLGFVFKFNVQGVWVALSCALLFAAVMHTWRFYARVRIIKL